MTLKIKKVYRNSSSLGIMVRSSAWYTTTDPGFQTSTDFFEVIDRKEKDGITQYEIGTIDGENHWIPDNQFKPDKVREATEDEEAKFLLSRKGSKKT
jgi:hypothetical protein